MSRKKDNAKWLNDRTYIDYFQRLKAMSLDVFKWENLPKTIDPRYIEEILFSRGQIVYFNDKTMGDLCLPFADGGKINIYEYPTIRQVTANNGYHNTLNCNNSVIIYNNSVKTPTYNTISLFAKKLANIERAIDINVNAQKTPIVILCDQSQRLTMKNVFNQYEGNEPVIYANKNLDMELIKVLKTDAPFVADKLETLKQRKWNECLTYLGIENSNTDKKERLVSSEVNGNDGAIENNRFTQLTARQLAVEKINNMFGTHINVTVRSNLVSNLNQEFTDLGGAINE